MRLVLHLLVGFDTPDLALGAGAGRVFDGGGDGDLPFTFAWAARFGGVDDTSFTFLGAHGFPHGPIFATVDAGLQVTLTPDLWLLARAASFQSGYVLAEAGVRSRVLGSPGKGGTYVRFTAGVHAVSGMICEGDVCDDGLVRSPSFALAVEWR